MRKADKRRELDRWKEAARQRLRYCFSEPKSVSVRDLEFIDGFVAWHLHRLDGPLRDADGRAIVNSGIFNRMRRTDLFEVLHANSAHVVTFETFDALQSAAKLEATYRAEDPDF